MTGFQKKIELLKKMVVPSRRVLILTHDNPDPDAIAAAFGFKYFLKEQFGQESIISYGGIVGRAENQSMIQHLKIPMTPVDQIRFQDDLFMVLMDTQPRTGNNSLPDTVVPDVVIDHHPLREETKKVPFSDVREEAGSCSSIITSYLREAGIGIQPRLATALYYGIKSDTNDFGRNADALDQESYLFLFPKVQRDILNRIIHPKVSAEYFRILNRAFKKARIHGSSLVTSIGRTRNPDMVAEVADMLLRHEGVEWVLVMGIFRKAMILSVRTSDMRGGAGDLVQGMVRGMGKAGGHGMMAGGKIDMKDGLKQELEEMLQERFLKKVGDINQPAEALV
ncbi:MAG: phosphoesterase [Nitrospirae bacterium CG_4_9_14_3_um_filter_53_35]|nr:MAG: hypothetical protein AUK29_07645 [Nitrospirae bacterium CG2_30_53_67]PIS37262.1 MAG: phosphoesterase [Nitrospirae bacterium CG08_land_8_20_14_0_20_52_24]PIV84807.1 MAG: phosphoesterase [Nitrospirae bacterium CG17_big_fil_post_rev_8_21_14_2_50_50_9]PIW84514.1 MAG: phosphoesterase [Nitrospirae bacterium CG_4_8_14_3_um_filter_50_41]PIX84587.1 MAG: phosphoesterase [Nitrospirae bacterium CG_4_10_14_3_um_filter_53_41]PJA77270.1 MAG: phosphoesterase [Nitrospirae bacterium CG_4_9_14_3_um_filte